ncbi:MAG: PHP domain-containing protein [Clostridia bacterium]|nr:PHP domain-containing protein [Clostridia bacterium]MBQ3870097.1 PHP domain-containing protein [Clostridia bacterium]
MIISDIHSHTYYSACGKDAPDTVIETAVKGGIEVFGICDHHYGIGERINEYKNELFDCRKRFKDDIKLLVGIEIATVPFHPFTKYEYTKDLDYCLVEHIDLPDSTVGTDIFDYPSKVYCSVGIAHTDLFALARKWGMTPLSLFCKLADAGIFWEMNVNYDRIHGYREHPYVLEFYKNEEQQNTVRDSGIKISVGFDGHRYEDYDPERVKRMCAFLNEKNIALWT